MAQTPQRITVSASGIVSFEECQAQFFHSQQRYADLLETDRVAAAASSAIHDALMAHHRQIVQSLRNGNLPSSADSRQRVRALLEYSLRTKRLDPVEADVAVRLAKLDAGIDRTADLILADVSTWVRQPGHALPLVWVEASLDHGPSVRAVELAPGFLVRTRPDVIGLRRTESGRVRVFIRDFKAKNEAVDPRFDTGILVRAVWVMLELMQPRCRWFLPVHAADMDVSTVELETVNLMHAESDQFLARTTLGQTQVLAERDRLIEVLKSMDGVIGSGSAEQVLASPNGLCLRWCPYLNHCQPGQDHVLMYYGEDVLVARLGTA
jgi:hypothetical protein